MQLVWIGLIVLTALGLGGAQRRVFGPGQCGPFDAVYIRNSTETGGQPFPMSPSEIDKMAVIMAETTRSDTTTILWAGGTAADAEGGFAVPVDPSVERVTFSVTFDGKGGSVEIVSPDGTVVQPKTRSEDTILNCGRILSVDAPASGVWRVTPKPTDRFWAVVHGRSDRDILSADFVRPGGRPGHEGLFKINGMPLAGRPATLRVHLTEPEEKAPDFILLSPQGRQIQRLDLERVDAEEFVGDIDLPAVPFRIAIAGTDETGATYQRVDKPLLHAETVEVVAGTGDTIKADQDTALTFIVRNHGPRARYRITAMIRGQILSRVEPPTVEIAEKGEQRVRVVVPAASLAAAGASVELMVVASSEDPAQTSSNAAFQRLDVVKQ